jgi:hypothetical protein
VGFERTPFCELRPLPSEALTSGLLSLHLLRYDFMVGTGYFSAHVNSGTDDWITSWFIVWSRGG